MDLDGAEIAQKQAQATATQAGAIRTLMDAGCDAETAIAAVTANDLTLLKP